MISGKILAIGDIHGQYENLLSLWGKLQRRYPPDFPQEDLHIVFLGDYVDRGPKSKDVIEFLCKLKASRPTHTHFLAGNHDFALAAFIGILPPGSPTTGYSAQRSEQIGDSIEDDTMHLQGRRYAHHLSVYDNYTTFESYGVNPESPERRDLLRAAIPQSHQDFLQSLLWVVEHEIYVFVHAGLAKFKRPPWSQWSIPQQLDILRRRDVSSGRPGPLCERFFPDVALEGLEDKIQVVGHVPCGFVPEIGRHIIRMDTSGGFGDNPISAILLPGNEVTASHEKR